MKLYCDNKLTINIIQNLVYHDKTKHVIMDKNLRLQTFKRSIEVLKEACYMFEVLHVIMDKNLRLQCFF